MANQAEVPVWEAAIYEIATTDPVEGGPGGIANVSLLQLANRTLYLKTFFESLLAPIISGKGWVLFDDIVSNIPPGWVEVTDMRGKLPAGQNASDASMAGIGQNGGAKVKSILEANLPAHHHKLFVNDNGGQASDGSTYVESGRYVAAQGSDGGPNSYKGSKPTNFNLPTLGRSEIVGGGQVLDVMNPYRIVLFIKWTGI